MSTRILFVDDDESILAAFQRTLRKQFEIEVAAGADLALAKLDSASPYAIVVADMQMPDRDGIELLKEIEQRSPDTVRMMLTGNADQKTAVQAVNEGHIFRFLNKPCPPEALTTALKAGLRQYRLVTTERELLEQTLNGAIRSLSDILRLVHPKLAATSGPQRDLIHRLCAKLGTAESWAIEVAAMLANVGFVTLPPAVMLKSSAGMVLNEAERLHLARIPETSSHVVACIPRLELVAEIIRYSRKDFDGAGFPPGDPSGEALPIGSRILRVVNDFLQQRQRGLGEADALERLRLSAGVYDPVVVSALREVARSTVPPHPPATEPALPIPFTSIRPSTPPATASLPRPGTSTASPASTAPAAPAAPPPAPPPATPGSSASRPVSHPLSILVVDDKPTIAELVGHGLAPHTTWKVTGCPGAEEALSVCRAAAPDLILLSVSLAEGAAFGLFQNLRALPALASTPILALCIKNATESQAEAHRVGFTAIVHKPIEIGALETKIIHALNLDTSERYFAQRNGALLITLPAMTDTAVATEVNLHFTRQLEAAADAGLTQLVLDLRAVQKPDLITIQLGTGIARNCQEMGLGFRVVGGETLATECLKYEETTAWDVMESLEEALSTPVGSRV